MVRYGRLIELANENVAAHRALLANVNARFQGGRAGEGDLEQVRERVEAALAVHAQFRQQYDEARGVFRRAIGIEPHNLRGPGRLGGLPTTKDEALAVTLRSNPTIAAAQADRDAAKHGFDATAGAFVPNLAFEGRALWGTNTGDDIRRSDRLQRDGRCKLGRIPRRPRCLETGRNVGALSRKSMRHARLQRGAYNRSIKLGRPERLQPIGSPR